MHVYENRETKNGNQVQINKTDKMFIYKNYFNPYKENRIQVAKITERYIKYFLSSKNL